MFDDLCDAVRRKVVHARLSLQHFAALLRGPFAGVALLVATVGIYSVVSYVMRGRRREIDIRTALGAQRATSFGW